MRIEFCYLLLWYCRSLAADEKYRNGSRLLCKPFLELVERLAAVGYLVLLGLVHLSVRLALVLERRVPA